MTLKLLSFVLLYAQINMTAVIAAPDKKQNESIDQQLDNTMKEKQSPWKKFPSIQAEELLSQRKINIEPKKGEALVLVFLASWCLPCQVLIDDLKKMEKKHNNSFSSFVYVFAHDTKADAEAFVKVHKLGKAISANAKILEDFHQPELPSIYVADRQSLMVMRRLGFNREALQEVDRFLDLHNSL